MKGIEWPIDAETKKASTTSTAKKVWIASLTALTEETTDYHFDLDSKLVEKANNLISKINDTPNKEWRHGYVPLLVELSVLMATASPVASIEMSRRGLNELNTLLTFERDDQIMSARDAVFLGGDSLTDDDDDDDTHKDLAFDSIIVNGTSEASPMTQFELGAPRRIPSDDVNQILVGEEMKAQLKAWADYGCIEPSCTVSGSDIADLEDSAQLVKDKVFVLLGATSALGPISTLLKIKGATIVAIARPGKKINALMERVKNETSESVTVVFPSRNKKIGADLITDTPELARWIANLYPEKQLVICCLAYLDGEKHVRASVGMDLICEYVCEKRKNTALSYIVSPATAHLAPVSAIENAKSKKDTTTPFWHKPFAYLKLGFQDPDVSPPPSTLPHYYVFNGLADFQGPNYALAKTTQQWRAMLAHSNGHVVSANHGPPSRTDSMVSHATVSVALEGMQHFPPLVAFDVPPANSLMAALMLWDFHFPEKSWAHSYEKLDHPMCLFVQNAAHGGSWRCPYDLDSIMAFSFMIGNIIESGKSPDGSLAEKS